MNTVEELDFGTEAKSGLPEIVEKKAWEPLKFSPKHKQMLAMKASGVFSQKEIATLLNVSESRLSIILNDDRAQEELERLAGQAVRQTLSETGEIIKSHTKEAVEKVVHLMRHSESERVQQTSAFDILDRGGFKPREVSIVASVEFNKEDAATIAEALRESKSKAPELEFIHDSAEVFETAIEITSARK